MSTSEPEAALAQLEDLVRRGQRPSHYVARRVLLALGQALRDGLAPAGDWVGRARAAGQAAGPAWAEGVRSELALACGEFAQCVDPRYLALPTYDLEYTRAARQRLADRLQASAELGFGLTPRETEVLELADRVLATFERQREADRAAAGPPATPPHSRSERASRSSHKKRRK